MSWSETLGLSLLKSSFGLALPQVVNPKRVKELTYDINASVSLT